MKKDLLRLMLGLHDGDPVDHLEDPEDTPPADPQTDPVDPVKAEDIADDDKGFVAFMKKIFVGEQSKLDDPEPKDDPEENPEDKSELALKYKNRYKEKYANQINEANAARELSDLKLTVATAKADGRAFDDKYLDFVCSEIQKSGKKPEEWLSEHPEYFEKQSAGAPIVKTNMKMSSVDEDYMKFLEKQRN